ncbi:RabGAP/TBC domain-containing protein [Dictyostelium discoideum AX4]|uniref:Putative mitotic check point protein BUB2 n=1 Tax=Dictyostelium discoideum TaxID=44689 RepID=BUB2_DICDI|nr:RabGAP/TBC domain-containing protein [Dictyostelium discoideum AX4]Q55EP9.1 RecName: Full=Putative mitotic check point protein BUB2 [Dictyostelium discoideum]EAL72986.1 RabGAP/TBC domain-containing protein [Dictyostelium discoideum AX4]|eukprot:XP_646971.1 RabGAP/TBC domain-containing protein [Dictyostelium discoideum AX4]
MVIKDLSPHNNSLRKKYLDLIDYGNKNPLTVDPNLYQLRKTILLEGLPPETEEEIEDRTKQDGSKCSLRGMIWKILLGVDKIQPDKYIELIEKGPSNRYQKIRKDIGRTFNRDSQFSQAVSQDQLSRCLNAFAHQCEELGYVQGMNAICGTFLYVLPEVEAFQCFYSLLTQCCPNYFTSNISGVNDASKLLDRILEFVDPELYEYLQNRSYHPLLFTPPILSLGTATPPLDELLKLWDFFLAFGFHLNVICTISQILLMRDVLLVHQSPCLLFRSFPELDAPTIINLSIHIIRQLPDDIYDLLVDHPMTSVDLTPFDRDPNNLNSFNGSGEFDNDNDNDNGNQDEEDDDDDDIDDGHNDYFNDNDE